MCTCIVSFPYYLNLLKSTSCPSPAAQLNAPWDTLPRGPSALLPMPGLHCCHGPSRVLLWLIRIASLVYSPPPRPPETLSKYLQSPSPVPGPVWGTRDKRWQDTRLSPKALGLWVREPGKGPVSISHRLTTTPRGYGSTETAGKAGMALGGGWERNGRGYPGQSQRQHGIFEEVQVVPWSRSMAMLRNSNFTLKAKFT